MGWQYVQFLHKLRGVEVAAVSDIRRDRMTEVATKIGARSFADAEGLATSGDVDVVFICTPEDQHVPGALAAIRSGKAVMIEKPLAHSLEAARSICEAAQAKNALVMVGHLLRFEPRWAAAKRVIAAGDIGDVQSISTRRVGNVLDQKVLGGRTTIPLYYGVHDLDIVRWFAGSEAETIFASRRSGALKALGYPIDDLYYAVLEFENDVLANAELGWHVPASAASAPTTGITVVGSKGWLKIEQADVGLQFWAESGQSGVHPVVDTSFWPQVHGVPSGALANELSHFLDCVRSDAQPVISLNDAFEALRLSLAMEVSADKHAVVRLAEFT
jgi:predicted dehydrogenase